jgi:hypothetical protein
MPPRNHQFTNGDDMLQRVTTLETIVAQLAANDSDKERRLRFIERAVTTVFGALMIMSWILTYIKK